MKDLLIIGDAAFTAEVELIVSQFAYGIAKAHNEAEARKRIADKAVKAVIFDADSFAGEARDKIVKIMRASGKDIIVVTSDRSTRAVDDAREWGARDCVLKPHNRREFIAHFNAVMNKKMRLSCIGGGTGLLNILMGLKTIPGVLLTSIVSNTDDGGSSGRLKTSFGVLPPGDIRRSLIALSNAPALMNQVMQHRFAKGDELRGHNFGNLFLTTLAEIKGSMVEAVKELADILYIQGIVLPIATSQTTLCAEFEDGTVIKSESKIDTCRDRAPDVRIARLWHEPEQECDIDAYSCIMNSDIITIGPGDLFTSVITNLITRNVRDALSRTAAKKVYICNLMTKPGETAGYTAYDHVKEVIKYLGGDYLDYILISNTRLSEKAISEYAKMTQAPVTPGDLKGMKELTSAKIIVADLSHETELVRHDENKIKREIEELISYCTCK